MIFCPQPYRFVSNAMPITRFGQNNDDAKAHPSHVFRPRKQPDAKPHFRPKAVFRPVTPFVYPLQFRSTREAERAAHAMGIETVNFQDDLAAATYIVNGLRRFYDAGYPSFRAIIPSNAIPNGSPAEVSGDTLRYNPGYDWANIQGHQRGMFDAGLISSGHPYAIIDHEMGHLLENMQRAKRRHFATWLSRQTLTGETTHPLRCDALSPQEVDLLSANVSRYAISQADGSEVVPEIFCGLMGGKSYSEAVMNLYQSYGGILNPNPV